MGIGVGDKGNSGGRECRGGRSSLGRKLAGHAG
jgi:hypothetical protein